MPIDTQAHPAHLITNLPDDQELVLKVIPMPGDCNANGDIFGGWVMAQVDLAGSVLPARVVRGRITTVAVKEFIFKQPCASATFCRFTHASRALATPPLRWWWSASRSAFALRASTSRSPRPPSPTSRLTTPANQRRLRTAKPPKSTKRYTHSLFLGRS